MTSKLAKLMLVAMIGLILVACGSESGEVPSLGATPTAVVEDVVLDDEAKVMAFTQCMCDQGIEFKDPVVDSDGNVGKLELVEGATVTRKELAEPYAACYHHIEGLTLGRERVDVSEQVDKFVALAT